jgi:NADH dehydrogenase
MKGPSTRPRVVIVGAGFGGLAAAKTLADADADVTVIDRHNYHLFQPLLYQVATAGLSPADIAAPIRSILRKQRNTSVLLGRVTGIDTGTREVHLGDRRIPYDYLVLATGARHAYFGRDDWEPFAPGLKKIEDALVIRRRILEAFELAESEPDPARHRQLLNFVVVGGGPTGVEMAGAIAELAKKALTSDFRKIDPRTARVILVEAGPRVLAGFPEKLSRAATCYLERLGVEVLTGRSVSRCDAGGVAVAEERIPSRTVIWAAGVIASAAAKWLGAEKDRVGRVMVRPDLSVPGHPDVFVVGDTAHVPGADGRPLPGIAAVAKQQGQYVARLIGGHIEGKAESAAFKYRDFGSLATIGRKAAVARLGKIEISGRAAWLVWSLAHIYFLIGARNRMAVLITWIWAYITFQHGSRLITDSTVDPEPSDVGAPATTAVQP